MCCQFSNNKQGQENDGGILISMKTYTTNMRSFHFITLVRLLLRSFLTTQRGAQTLTAGKVLSLWGLSPLYPLNARKLT